jgi:hypothetical protein
VPRVVRPEFAVVGGVVRILTKDRTMAPSKAQVEAARRTRVWRPGSLRGLMPELSSLPASDLNAVPNEGSTPVAPVIVTTIPVIFGRFDCAS